MFPAFNIYWAVVVSHTCMMESLATWQ